MTTTSLIAAILATAGMMPASAPSPATRPAALAIPADAQKAPHALKDSPRHGEWVDIAMPGSDVKLHTFIVYPERKDKAPVVLVIHEIFGLTDWVRAVADELAAAGCIAVAPDLLSGMGPGGGGTEALGEGARDAIRRLTPDQTAARLNAARAYALALPAASDKCASIGFCWGGSASFAYATQQPGLNAAVVYYGTAPTDHDALASINCPVLGLYGSDDARVTATVDATAKAMGELGKSFDHRVFDGAGHGFLRQQDGKDGANLKAAQQAWARTIAFLTKNLQ